MALGSGTTSNKCILFNEKDDICSVAQKGFIQYFPKPGWVGHGANEIWPTQLDAAVEAMSKIGATAEDIATIGIANQHETTIVWDRETGKPMYYAIVWQCHRISEYCSSLREKGLADTSRAKTGLVIDAYFSGTKLKWILDNVEGMRERAGEGELLLGIVKTWLTWKLTRGRVHMTDYFNVSCTMLFNISTLGWDDEILAELNIPKRMLSEAKSSSCVYGLPDPSFFGGEISIDGVVGDQQAILFGQACYSPGEIKDTCGTGCFTLMNTGEKPVFSRNSPVTTIARDLDGKVNHALEGSVFAVGATIQRFRNETRLIDPSPDSKYTAKKVEDTNGCYAVPVFMRSGAPHWDQYARETTVGLTRGMNKYHIIRATLDSLCYQISGVPQAVKADSGIELAAFKAGGGASVGNYPMRIQADIINVSINRPQCVETTVMRAAYLADLIVGYWANKEEVIRNWAINRTSTPEIYGEKRAEMVNGWDKAMKHSYGRAKEE